jgi:FkbM family methyltransferase
MSGFRDFAIRHARHSHGQLLQDLWVAFELGSKQGGFFVEFGATNGMTFSNTILLERHFGWTGILAEPNPVFHPKLRAARTARIATQAVHALSGHTVDFLCASRPMMSRLAGFGEALPAPEIAAKVTVETISLDDLLDAHDAPDRIDFLSVDTEGSEWEILSAFDFARRPVTLIAVEHNHGTRRDALHRLLTGHGYVQRAPALSRFDGWYRHASTL